MPEQAFLRSVVPTVSPPGHGLTKVVIIQDRNELGACILTSLIGMDEGICLQLGTVLFHQLIYSFQNEIRIARAAAGTRQYLFSKGIHDDTDIGKVVGAFAAFTVCRSRDICNIRQKNRARPERSELSVEDVRSRLVFLQSLALLTIWIDLPYRAGKMVLFHQSADLLGIHQHRRILMQQSHVNPACTL